LLRIRPETEEEVNSWRTVVKVLDEHVLVFDPADLNKVLLFSGYDLLFLSHEHRFLLLLDWIQSLASARIFLFLFQQTQRGVPNHSQRCRDIKFAFDWVFDQDATQQEVYERTTKHLIDEVLSGFNCTCFAYGATGTFHMTKKKRDQTIEE
jgi:hypothetical protein